MTSVPRQTLCTVLVEIPRAAFFSLVIEGQVFSYTLTRITYCSVHVCICLFTVISASNASSPSAWCHGSDDTHICSPPPSPLLPRARSTHCASPLHMSASHWHCPSYPLEASSNLSGLAYTHGSRRLPLSTPSLPQRAAARRCRRCRRCQWALRHLMASPTCRYCGIQACPICLSNLAGTSWPDSLHADRWTMVGLDDHSYSQQSGRADWRE